MDHDHSFEPTHKRKKSHVVTSGYFVVDELNKIVNHIRKSTGITKENRKKLVSLAQEIIDRLKHEN